MLAQAYAYGHLVTAAISIAIAVAFAVFAWRLPAYRRDVVYAVVALTCAALGVVAMMVALEPSLGRARLLFGVAIVLYVSVPVMWHVQFAHDVFEDRTRRRHRAWTIAYALGGLTLLILLAMGILDEGRLRVVDMGTVTSGVPAISWRWFFVIFPFACTIIPLSARLLAAAGPRRRERRSALPLMLFAPPLCAHELLVAVGVYEVVPVGGYLAGLFSLQGVIILTERLRALTEPRHLGPYRIERKLGAGGMAEVFLAHRSGTGPLEAVSQPVALKRLHGQVADDPEQVRRFIEEARILGRLAHPNIVGLLDAGQQDGQLYIALELIEGASLARLIDRARIEGKPFSPSAVVEVGIQLAEAIACAHAAGLIHRDVSPQNVLVDGHGTVKLSDFGIARSIDRTATRTGTVRGKLPYIAPEQLRGIPYDGRVDLWALGVILHQLAAGSLPFAGESDAEIIYSVVEGRRQGRSRVEEGVGRALADLIDGMLEVDPARRLAEAGAAIEVFREMRDARAGRSELIERVGASDSPVIASEHSRSATRAL